MPEIDLSDFDMACLIAKWIAKLPEQFQEKATVLTAMFVRMGAAWTRDWLNLALSGKNEEAYEMADGAMSPAESDANVDAITAASNAINAETAASVEEQKKTWLTVGMTAAGLLVTLL